MKITKPFAHEHLPNLNVEESTTKAVMTARIFIDSMFFDAQKVPWETRAFWLGMLSMQSPKDRILVMSRPQDPTKFFELTKKGLPFLSLGGRQDSAVNSAVIYDEFKETIPNLKVAWIEERGSHAMFYDNMEGTMKEIIDFLEKDCN